MKKLRRKNPLNLVQLERENLIAGKSKKSEKKLVEYEAEVSGVLQRFDKKHQATEYGTSFGMIKAVYSDSIEYAGVAKGSRGLMLFAGLLGGVAGVWMGCRLLVSYFEDNISLFLLPVVPLIIIFIILYPIFLAIKCVRMELFRPIDEPIIFDRKNRKIYRIFRVVYSGWRGLFVSWPMKYAEHDWDLVDAEHQAAVGTNGSTITRFHALMFLVRKSAEDPTPVDSFLVGTSMQMGELVVPAVWEHIRRFMEDGGPALTLGDALMTENAPKTFFQCMVDSGPYGKNFRIWWQEIGLLLILALIIFPILFPFLTLIGIFAWFSYKTSFPIAWPKHICEAVAS